jgi:Tol biopolymer transport system component
MNKYLGAIATISLLICWPSGLSTAIVPQRLDRTSHPYDVAGPKPEPTVFAEGIISTGDYDSHPAFTPDGKTLYFLRSDPNFSFWTILVSRFENGRWRTPQVAPFSGQYSDADPFITSDGSRLYFISNRPVAGKSKPDLDIWMMEKTERGWSEPKNPGAPINSSGNEWYPTLAANGTIYFGSDREGGKGRTDIYRARLVNGAYTQAENLGDAVNSKLNEFEPLIAPDESYMIFMAGGRADGHGGFDLYITYNRNGEWTNPTNLGDQINTSGNEYSPTISPDKKYFFWTSARSFAEKPLTKPLNFQELTNRLRGPRNGLGDIYQIDIGKLNIRK